ncbi:MAG TPA: TadE/TadG family type IV pilus assembly protein [Stellaceae bacterium]|nr:TadE/TadG family type IV pilus assembly protein [Stellaceae bacterium]
MMNVPVRALRALDILRAENSGVVAIEFALVAMMFLTILAGTVDLGILIYVEEKLDTAVAAGAEYAEANAANVNSSGGSNLAAAIAGVVANANGSGWANSGVCVNNGPTAAVNGSAPACSGTASNADSSYCPSGSPPSWSWGSAETPGSACSGGGIAGKFVAITVSRNISPIFPSFGFVQNGTISQSVLVQTQ